jgi:hypothetical protein
MTFGFGFGWNLFAHSMIARVAEMELSQDPKGMATLKKIYATLNTLTAFFPELPNSLMDVAVTPDMLNFNFKGFLAGYHYKDIPETYRNEKTKMNIPTEPEVNADYAIESAIGIIKDSFNPEIEEKHYIKKGFMDSLMTRYLIHLVGDVHQPLHTIGFYSKILMDGRIEKGDLGGNLIYINDPYKSGSKNLHSFWDGGLGLFPEIVVFPYSPEDRLRVNEMAESLMKEFPKTYYGSDVTQLNHKSWIDESHKLAVQIAYADVDLFPLIRPEYVILGRRIAKERVILAGYRLANLLRDIFK